jgi:hypothetical protein
MIYGYGESLAGSPMAVFVQRFFSKQAEQLVDGFRRMPVFVKGTSVFMTAWQSSVLRALNLAKQL